MSGVAMIGGDPLELRPEVFLHLRHQPADEWLQVGILIAVLGRDDKAELVAVTTPTLDECRAVGHVTIGRVKAAGSAIRGGAVALKIAQVRPAGRDPFRTQPNQPRFDHGTPAAETGMPITAVEHATDARAASNPAAIETA